MKNEKKIKYEKKRKKLKFEKKRKKTRLNNLNENLLMLIF
jgi:hypothetical protein